MSGAGPAQALAAFMLLCGFALLPRYRVAMMITLLRLQAIALAAATCWQAAALSHDGLLLTGLITLGINAVLLPTLLRRVAGRFGLLSATLPAMPLALSIVLGLALIAVATLAMPALPGSGPTRENLSIALAVVLLGLLVMTTRRDPLVQAIGFLATANGLVLAATFLPTLPFTAAISIALSGFTGLLLGNVFLMLKSAADAAAMPAWRDEMPR